MYQLLNNGEHPLYQPGDNLESYADKIKKLPNHTSSAFMFRVIQQLPKRSYKQLFFFCIRLAQSLLLKLLTYDPNERYSAADVLQHPWITRRPSDKIPMSLSDRMKAYYNTQTILRVNAE